MTGKLEFLLIRPLFKLSGVSVVIVVNFKISRQVRQEISLFAIEAFNAPIVVALVTGSNPGDRVEMVDGVDVVDVVGPAGEKRYAKTERR
ncbi:MAG: hypothetical protein ACRDFQ_08065 [Anaerolineales bacterium]